MLPAADALMPVLRLLLAALLGGVAGASLASVAYRRAARADAARWAAGIARVDVVDGAGTDARVDPHADTDPERRDALVRSLARSRSREAAWRKRHEALDARERVARRRVDTLLAEQQAAEGRQSRLEAEVRNLRAERDLVARSARTPLAAAPFAGDVHPDDPRDDAGATGMADGARPEGLPVLNRRVGADAHAHDGGIDDYPMLAESELPERADSLRLEDLLDEGTT